MFTGNELLEGVLDVLHILNLDGDVIKDLLSVDDGVAVLTDELCACLASVDSIHDMLEWGVLKRGLQFIKDPIQELLSILLNTNVNRVAGVVLE